MGKIEKLVVLGVLLVIVGILGATQVLTPGSHRMALGAEPGEVEVMPQDGGAEPTVDPWQVVEEQSLPTPSREDVGGVGAPQGAPAEPLMPQRPMEPQAAPLVGDLLSMEGLSAYPMPGYWVCTVQEGETLASLAERLYGAPERAVLLQRDNEGVETLEAGQELLVCELDDGYTGARTHVVQQGESLWSIAEAAYGKGWLHERIQDANADQLGAGAKLKPGMVLRLPSMD
ncbi:MAG: LysM peptidoglycan-binding domain-containing protein [Planctomycetes bacterium]|nr:LysM peptidoglycan-binding domain-containing protein [Planctomycetota bacterium]MDA0948419.1 LysM peptidoglycan-binding domain-containing protein [Planctomycetota bacterium]